MGYDLGSLGISPRVCDVLWLDFWKVSFVSKLTCKRIVLT